MATVRSYTRGRPKPKPRNDAYIGILLLSLIAMLTGCLLLYLDFSQYGELKPPNVSSLTTPPAPKAAPVQPPPPPADGGGEPPPGGGGNAPVIVPGNGGNQGMMNNQ
ncbi:MAG: hypothetical protein ACK4RK_18160 [Gemmataceae bacterium]